MKLEKLTHNRFIHISWARLVSDVLSPPIIWTVLAVPVGIKYSADLYHALFWAGLYAFFIALVPVLFILFMMRAGKIGDIHMKERRERFAPFVVTIISTIIAWVLLQHLDAPFAFSLMALIGIVQIAATSVITLFWQISMHMMSIASAGVAVGILFSIEVALMIIPLIILVGAARLKLKRHTPYQVIAGTALGAALPLLFIINMPQSLLQTL